jgi:hypothetical protein
VQVVACPLGTYQPDYMPFGTLASDTKCRECLQGATTRFNASTSAAACNSKLLADSAWQGLCRLTAQSNSLASIWLYCNACAALLGTQHFDATLPPVRVSCSCAQVVPSTINCPTWED